MIYQLLFSSYGYMAYRKEGQLLEALHVRIEHLRMEKDQLARKIVRLRHSKEAQEALIRKELGYVYADEYVVLFPHASEASRKTTPQE